MRKRILYISLITLFAIVAVLFAQYSTANYREQGGARTVIGGDIDIVDGGEINIEDGGDFYMEPTDDQPTAAEGWIYFDDSDNALTFHNGSGWVTLSTGTGDNTLDDAYDESSDGQGKKVDVDSGAIEFEVSIGDDNPALHLDGNNTTNDPVVLLIENAADLANAVTVDIDAQSTGRDIEGTGATWYVTGAGALTAVSGTIPTMTVATSLTAGAGIILDSGDTITNATDTEIIFTDTGGENFGFDLAEGTNAVGLISNSGVDELAMGAVDDLTGVGTIVFDAASASITQTAGSGGEDFTISMAGGVDASLILTSAGTGADALQLSTSSGGMDITMAGSGDGEDLDLLSSRSLTLTSTEATADAIKLYASHADGGIAVDFGTANMTITGTGISADFTVDADLISFDGTGDLNFTTVGGAAEDITIYQNCGNTDASIHIKSNGNGADALTISTLTNGGGIDIIADGDTGDAGDLDITNTNGSVNISAGEEIANAVFIQNTGAGGGIDINGGTAGITIDGTGIISIDGADDMNFTVTSGGSGEDLTIAQLGSNDSSIIITSEGQGANAIELTTSDALGDIDINAGDAITIDAGDIVITTDDTAANQFQVVAGGTHGGDVINLGATDGGIVLTAAGATNGDVTITAASMIAVGASDDITITLTAGTAGEDLSLITTGGADSSIVLTADGTSANAIDINTTAGGIDIDMSGGIAGEDFSITTATSIDFAITEAAADQFKVNAQGTIDGDAINFETSDGGIMLNADGGTYGDIELNAEDVITMVAAKSGSTFATTATADAAKGLTVTGAIATATYSEGAALYVGTALTGNSDGKVYSFGAWLDITGSCTPTDGPDALLAAADIGIYAAASPTLSAAKLMVLNLEYQVHGSAPPEVSSMIHFNADSGQDVPDYLFTFGNADAAVYTVNTTHSASDTAKAGAIKINISGTGDRYIFLYSDAGS